MKIESIIKRSKGTTVELDGETYQFNSDNNHITEVTEPSHIELLLSITEGFRIAGEKSQPIIDHSQPSVKTEPRDTIMPSYDEEGDDECESQPNTGREEAVSLYAERFGKKPHYKWSVERIYQALSE